MILGAYVTMILGAYVTRFTKQDYRIFTVLLSEDEN